jgi:hypothetical protein
MGQNKDKVQLEFRNLACRLRGELNTEAEGITIVRCRYQEWNSGDCNKMRTNLVLKWSINPVFNPKPL